MRGLRFLQALRHSGKRPSRVAVALVTKHAHTSTWTDQNPFDLSLVHVEIETADDLGSSEWRAFVGLEVHLSDYADCDRRLRAVTAALVASGAATLYVTRVRNGDVTLHVHDGNGWRAAA